MPTEHQLAANPEQIFEALRGLKVQRSLIEKLHLAQQGNYDPGETVTLSRDALILIAQTNYLRGEEHERERCAKIVDEALGEGNWISKRIRGLVGLE